MKNVGNIVAVGVVRESRKFRAPIYRAYRAVIFATAQLSCKRFLYIKVYVIAYTVYYTLQRPLSLLTVCLVALGLILFYGLFKRFRHNYSRQNDY